MISAGLVCTPAWAAPGRAAGYLTDSGQLAYGNFLLGEGEYLEAAREFSRLIEEFPASPLLAEAQFNKALANLRAKRGGEAADGFRLFIENFKESPLRGEAGRLLLEARLIERTGRTGAPQRGKQTMALRPAVPMRAVQVALFEAGSYAEIEAELGRLKASGIDTVIVRVFHNNEDRFYRVASAERPPGLASGVYFSTDKAPVIGDVLGPVVEAAHSRGLRVFAWMTTRYADYGIEERADLSCRGYDPLNRSERGCKGLDLFNELAVRHLEALYSDLAEYAIDGILFQDDLVLRHTEGFGRYAESLFFTETGSTLDPETLYRMTDGRVRYTEHFWEWAAWKNRRLIRVAERLRAAVREKNPGVLFAVNLMYESVTNPPYALAWLSQDLDAALDAGFDYLSIMAYHRQMGDELGRDPAYIEGLIERMARSASEKAGDPARVLIKLQTIDWNTGEPLADREVTGLIRRVRAAAPVSLAVVPYRGDFPFFELAGAHRAPGAMQTALPYEHTTESMR